MKHCPNLDCPHIDLYQAIGEYNDDVGLCAHCQTPLVHGPSPSIGPNESEMEQVYTSHDAYLVDLAKTALQSAGIASFETVGGSSGLLPFEPTILEVHADQAERAREVLASVEAPAEPASDWECPTCGALIPGTLEACWSCAGEPPPDADDDASDDEEEGLDDLNDLDDASDDDEEDLDEVEEAADIEKPDANP